MKYSFFLFFALISFTSSSVFLFGQTDVRFYYEGYGGCCFVDLAIGETAYVNSDGDQIGADFFNSDAAIIATRVDGDWNPYPNSASENYFVYMDDDFPAVLGTNQYEDINIRVKCIAKAETLADLPQPDVFVPIDRVNATYNPEDPNPYINIDPGTRVLMLRKAFFWENSEDLGCPHGPWAELNIKTLPSGILNNYSNLELSQNTNIWQVPQNGSTRLPGPIYFADEDCLFNIYDAYSEWIDGPWGALYSNLPVHVWEEGGPTTIGVFVAEADGSNPEDFLGGREVSIDDDFVLLRCWMFGWVLLENVDFNGPSDSEHSVDVGNFYWYYDWDGSYPANSQVEGASIWDQYIPLSGSSIDEMEATFPAGSKIGLMGGKFPAGTLNKPMIYKASDVPAVFK